MKVVTRRLITRLLASQIPIDSLKKIKKKITYVVKGRGKRKVAKLNKVYPPGKHKTG